MGRTSANWTWDHLLEECEEAERTLRALEEAIHDKSEEACDRARELAGEATAIATRVESLVMEGEG